MMNRALNYPGRVVIGLFTLLASIYIGYGVLGEGIEMWPPADPDGGVVLIHARGDLSVLEQDQLVRLVEERIYGIKDIKNYYVRSGSTSAGATDDVIGSITLNYFDWRWRRPYRRGHTPYGGT